MKKILPLTCALLISITIDAQDVEQIAKADPVSFAGGVTWSNIFTWPKDSADVTPTYAYYLSGNLSTTLFGTVSIPVSFTYTNNQLTSTVTYPFNRFALTPSWRWIRLHIGYSQLTFSPYTMAGHDFMGGGVELTPDEMPWRFAAYYGRYNKAVPRDSINTEPIYKRMGGGVLVGYKSEAFTVDVNLTMAKDDAASLTFANGIDTTYVAPQSNLAGSIALMWHPWSGGTLDGEYARSIVNANTDAGGNFFDDDINVSNHDAFRISAKQAFEIGSAGVTLERVAPEYQSFSSYYNTEDFMNITLDVDANIRQKISVAANVGLQKDNLLGQEVNTNSQLIYSCNVNVTPNERLILGGSVSNIQSYVHIKDILEQVSQTNQYQNLDTLSFTELNFSSMLNASYRLNDEGNISQTISASYTYQQASHEQAHCKRFISNRLHNGNLNYQMTHKPTKISASAGVNYNKNLTPEVNTDVLTICGSASAPIGKALHTSLTVNHSQVASSLTNYRILNIRASASLSFLKYHSVNCSLTALNNTANPNSRTQFSANITYSLSLGYTIKRRAKTENAGL